MKRFRKLLILLFMFLGINWLNCMQRGGDIEMGGPPVQAEPVGLRPSSPTARLKRLISAQLKAFRAAQDQEVNPLINDVIANIESCYDPIYKILDLSSARLHFQLMWKDFLFLFEHISNFFINDSAHEVRTLDLRGNNLTSDGLPALLILSMIKNKSLSIIQLEENPICDDANLDVFIKEFTGRMNLKNLWKRFLNIFINSGEERIDVEVAAREEHDVQNSLVLDFGPGLHQYKLKKCLDRDQASWSQRLIPFLIKLSVWSSAGGLVFLSSPYIEDFLGSYDQCDVDIANQWLEICGFENLTIG